MTKKLTVKYKINNPIRYIKTANGGLIISGQVGRAGLRY